MSVRLNFYHASPEAIKLMIGQENYLSGLTGANEGLDKKLLELVKIRVSQINGCAYCLDMHTKDTRLLGETEQRLYTLSAWREAPFFTAQEQAALKWAEALTQVATKEVSDELFLEVKEYFSERQMVDLTLAINAINSWNRFVRGFGADVGSYQPAGA